jgi:Tfp pilus assembly protein PilV
MANHTNDGSTLIEVLVAMLVLTSGVLAMSQLFQVAAATNTAARHATMTATLAAQKTEQLLSTDLALTSGNVDHVDTWGRVVGTSVSPPAQAVYTRQWSVEPVSGEMVMIRVHVGLSDRSGGLRRTTGVSRVVMFASRRRS